MICESCRRGGAPFDEGSPWTPVTDGAAAVPLLECTNCEHRQHLR